MIISEIMYDLKVGSDDGREWVEVFNDGDKTVDLSTYKFFEANTNHKIILVEGEVKIPPGGYAVIVSDPVKFKIDFPNFSGTFFDSSFSLNNSGENLALKDGENLVDEYFYNSSSGGAGNGTTLSKINGVWASGTPTPGSENKIFVKPAAPMVKETPKKSASTSPVAQVHEENETVITTEAPLIQNSTENSPEKYPNLVSNTALFSFPVLIIFGAFLVYFLRKKRKKQEVGENYDILA